MNEDKGLAVGQGWYVGLPGTYNVVKSEIIELTEKTVLLSSRIPYGDKPDVFTQKQDRYVTEYVNFVEKLYG